MACFWNGILSQLSPADFLPFGLEKKPKPKQFVLLLQINNVRTSAVSCQGTRLTEQQMEENYQSVEGYDKEKVNDGYLCSSSDPFLFLVSEIFLVDIDHKYLNKIIQYRHVRGKRTLHFQSNKSHFQPA